MRVVLDGAAFSKLVQGGELEFPGLKIILSDIGFSVMHHLIEEAERKTWNENISSTEA